ADTREREEFLVHNSDATIVASPIERALLRGSVPGANVVAAAFSRSESLPVNSYAERRDIGFIRGVGHPPDVDAVAFFVADIWPRINRRLISCHFSIVGYGLPAGVLQNAPADVEYLGYVPNVASWFNRPRISVAPVRCGAGPRAKVLSSL